MAFVRPTARFPGDLLMAASASLLTRVPFALQGIAFGLTNGGLPVLLARQTSYSQLSQLSFASCPYAFMVLFAPLVDAFGSGRVGRRKSWVLPCTMLSGAVFFWWGRCALDAEYIHCVCFCASGGCSLGSCRSGRC